MVSEQKAQYFRGFWEGEAVGFEGTKTVINMTKIFRCSKSTPKNRKILRIFA